MTRKRTGELVLLASWFCFLLFLCSWRFALEFHAEYEVKKGKTFKKELFENYKERTFVQFKAQATTLFAVLTCIATPVLFIIGINVRFQS